MGLYWGLEHHEAIKFQLNVIHEAAQKWPELHELLLLQYIDKNLRVYDHQIPIKKGSQPANYRPYRYAAEQKNVIEKMFDDMLEAGVIKHNASLVVLVKKKDKT